jgi:hypothetical protein
MQFVLSLLGLFAVGCVLYGLSAGVQAIARGFGALASDGGSSGTKKPQRSSVPQAAATAAPTGKTPDAPTLPQRCINELQALFDLYRSGALTQKEFEQCKWHVLHSLTHGGVAHE